MMMPIKLHILLLCLLIFTILSMHGTQAGHSLEPTPAPTAQPVSHHMYGVTQGSLQPEECSGRCTERCSATQYKKPCMFFCQKCCAKCLCVPPGTYGNKQSCPCYNNWKTKRGGPKCP
ncbi:protein GAST1-like [Dioscorea cayenensis subsp. rotundata]|uniref:Protein GAST1-like n=1 Tax=Dioscorea cayennensis subsp. rotundata TaxID=55577 RepID=A0AB40CD39_DIOCR|nr:protein GAST1-like [Dioscorea cayenensis subsp. rotundata]